MVGWLITSVGVPRARGLITTVVPYVFERFARGNPPAPATRGGWFQMRSGVRDIAWARQIGGSLCE